jgi:hypothetical protein
MINFQEKFFNDPFLPLITLPSAADQMDAVRSAGKNSAFSTCRTFDFPRYRAHLLFAGGTVSAKNPRSV